VKKIVLATPPVSLKERYGTLAGAGNTMPCLGLLSLAAVARKKGFDCSIVEASSLCLGLDETVHEIISLSPDYVGLTSTTLSIWAAAELAQKVKIENSRFKIIVGGPHLTALPYETLQAFPAFDYGVIGEGEETLVDLLLALEGNGDVKKVKGIVYRDTDHIEITERRPFIDDLDSLPLPAWDLLEGFPRRYRPPAFRFRRLPAASLVTSRGCPNTCIFCDRSVFGNRCRSFSSGYILEMVKFLCHRYGIKELLIEDDTFFLSRQRIREFCEGLLKENLQLSWSCLGRVNTVDREILTLMKRAGCWQIGFGIESGDQKILDLAKKNISLSQVKEAIRLTREAGIESKGFFILGFPQEDRETLRQTSTFARTLLLDDISINFMTPFPGSQLFQDAHLYGQFDADWRKMNMLRVVFVPHDLTEADLVKTSHDLWKHFYLRHRIIFGYLKRLIRNPMIGFSLFKGFFAFIALLFKREN
jgi:radical SAM superfamily enzyme YgiQ (UPF0313 family)